MRSFNVQVIRSNDDDLGPLLQKQRSQSLANPEYNDACFDIFEDEERSRLLPIEDVVGNFRRALEEISSDEDIRQASKTEEALIESDA